MQFGHDVAHPLAHRADAGALGVQAVDVGADRDLGAVPGFAGDGDDLDAAVGDLGDLEGEQLADEIRVGAADGDLRAAEPARHADDVGLDAGAVAVFLARHLLGLRQQRLDLADVDQDEPALRRPGRRPAPRR